MNPKTENGGVGVNPKTLNGVNPKTLNGVNPKTLKDVKEVEFADVPEFPLSFVAYTLYVCAVPASCATFTDVEAVDPLFPSEEVHVYPVIAFPPVAGAVHVTTSVA